MMVSCTQLFIAMYRIGSSNDISTQILVRAHSIAFKSRPFYNQILKSNPGQDSLARYPQYGRTSPKSWLVDKTTVLAALY